MHTPGSSDSIQINPEALLSTSPQFYAASDAINAAADTLKGAIANAAAAWDGDAQKQLIELGNSFVKNLQDLAQAMEQIGISLYQSSRQASGVDGHQSRLFNINAN